MEAVIQLKKSKANTSILCIIIGKFSHRQKVSSVILFVVDKGPEIGFRSTILHFCQPICLRVKDGKKSLLDA